MRKLTVEFHSGTSVGMFCNQLHDFLTEVCVVNDHLKNDENEIIHRVIKPQGGMISLQTPAAIYPQTWLQGVEVPM